MRARAIALVLCSFGACGRNTEHERNVATPRPSLAPAAVATPRLPAPAGRFAPARTELASQAVLSGADLADVNRCDGCHAEIVAQWRSSAHAFASLTNPIYRVSIDALRDAVGHGPSRFCGGCHDPALLIDGKLDQPFDEHDARSHAGVSCALCHGVQKAEIDGNGSYTLRAEPILVPRSEDPTEVKRHVESAAPLRSPKLCGSCHRAFLTRESGNQHFFAGADDLTPWMRSAYAGSRAERVDTALEPRDCAGCHMPRIEISRREVAADARHVRSHRMLGGHSWLAAMQRDAALLERYAQHLRGVASVDIAAASVDGRRVLAGESVQLKPGADVTLDIVIFNERVGHRFPGGTLDIQDTWLEVSVVDALGKRIAQAGTRQQSGRADPSAHVLRVLVIDGDGAPVRAHATHRFRTVAYDHSVAPRDADVVQVSFRVPQTLDKARLPLQAIARLRHRSRSLDMQQAACDAERSERGRRFAEATKAIGRHLDPCAAQPVFEIAATRAQLGGGRGLSSDTSPRWLRLYRHGLALLDVVGERVHEAAPSLRAALGDADIEDATQRSQIHVALARMLARQGRPEDAIEELTAASALTPDHPAIDRAHGEALLRVWRFDQAVMPLSRASDAAPLDDSGWVSLATALGSLGRGAEALGAVKRALIWQPRSEPLLRIQALVLGRVPVKESALDAYLEHREDDRASVFRRRCSEQSELCRLERVPIHTHSMR